MKKKDKIIYLVYGALALVVLFPLLVKSGYIFAMDMVFTPHLSWPEPFNVTGAFLYLLNFILPSQVIQKILLFLILFLAGIGMHRLIPTEDELPKYFAGIFYIFNPFVYNRFLFGHWLLLLAYALMPFAVKAIFEFFNNLNFRNALKLSFWFVLIGFISSHFIVFVILFFIIAFLVYLIKNRRTRTNILIMFRYGILISLLFLIFSSWWILPYFDKTFSQGQYIQETISQKDFEAFTTEPDAKYGVLLNVAALYGFWGDRGGEYVVPKDVIPYWFLLFLIILALVIWGAISSFKKNKFITAAFIAVAAVAFILSVGIAYQSFASLINFLNEKIFIFKGFRDSQKFTALLVLVYAYFGTIGVSSILRYSKVQKLKNLKVWLAVLFLALPVLYSPLMVWGFGGQLKPHCYPQSWFKANELLNQDRDNFKVLFFPWHQYMPFSFIDNKVVANPAPQFFDKETIAGDNMEVGEIYTHSKRPISQVVENVILRRIQGIDNFGEMLFPFNIKYVLLAKEADWLEYKFLDAQKDLEPIFDSEKLRIYQNKGF